ncbi:MAG TPA: hypothetical protein PLV92_24940, partial [Pirellulaceae bacterium]|nr:hypothetical protein [Pirellulaceae bacterium]
QIAEDAAEFANATSVDSDTYEKMLGKTLATAQEKIKEVMRETESKWGGYIMKKGELFTRLADQYLQERNTQNRTLIEKAFEQGQTYLDSTKASIDRQIKAVVDFVNKTTRRVPQEYQRSLKPQVDKLRMAAITILNFQKKFDQNYDATQVEFKRMAGLID